MKKGLMGLLVLMILGFSFLVVSSLLKDLAFSISSPGAYANLTGSGLNLSVTVVANSSHGNHIKNVTFMWSNKTNAYMFNVTVHNNSANQTTFNTTFNTALLADGIYNISINVTNITGPVGSGQSENGNGQNLSVIGFNGYNVTIDNTAPSVTMNLTSTSTTSGTGFAIANGTNFSASRGNISMNFTIDDFKPAQVGDGGAYHANSFNISTVTFVFSNGTGADFNYSSVNQSGARLGLVENRSGVWTVNYNLSSLAEGTQGIILYANDTVNNTRVVIFNFTVDRTTPVKTAFATSNVGTTSAKVTITINESVDNCTYTSVAGAQGSVGSGNFSVDTAGVLTTYSKTFSSLTAATGYQIEVKCTDFVGYTVTDSISWATSAAATTSNAGSGAGGSSGGISTGVQGSFEKKVWTSINAGETASVALKNGVLGVTEVSFSVPNTVYGAWVHVTKKDSLPSSVSAFSGKVYKIIEITKGPALAKEGAYTDATVKFKVEKVWLAENGLAKDAVDLHRYVDGKWTELVSVVGEDDGTYIQYSAKTPSFSYFVIGQKSGAVVAAPKAEAAPVVEAPVEEAVEEAPAEELAVEQKGTSKVLLVALLAVAVVIVAVVLYMRKRR